VCVFSDANCGKRENCVCRLEAFDAVRAAEAESRILEDAFPDYEKARRVLDDAREELLGVRWSCETRPVRAA